MLAPLGYALREADNFSLQKVLDTAQGKPQAPAVHMMVLRSLMKARYDVENLGHFGLAAKYYCHFTSPIRRYPDLMVHRILTALLDGRLSGGVRESSWPPRSSRRPCSPPSGSWPPRAPSGRLRNATWPSSWPAMWGRPFPAPCPASPGSASSSPCPTGWRACSPSRPCPDDGYRYDEIRMTLTGSRTKTAYTFGMPLEVVCAAADPGHRPDRFCPSWRPACPASHPSGGAPGGDAPAPGERQAGHACAQGAEREEKTMTKRMLLAVLLLIVFALPAGCQKQGGEPTQPTAPAPTILPTPTPEPAPTPTPDRVGEALAGMTVEQKAAQLLVAGIEGTEPGEDAVQAIQGYQVGGVILFGRNVESAEQLAALTNGLKELNGDYVPLFLCVDQEGGRVDRMPPEVTDLPSALDFGSIADPEARMDACFTLGQTLAAQCAAFGFNMDFAPSLDIWSNPENTVIGDRAFGTDAATVTGAAN